MNILATLAALAFLIATIWHAIQKTWPLTFLSAGLCLLALNASTLIPT